MSTPETQESGNDEKKKLFFTTSDLMNTMNKYFADSASSDSILETPKVELQRRLPDGSTRRADDKDLAAADMESKLKQAALEVEDLPVEKKMQWAERQRQEGNVLYQQEDYLAALDCYLTCLVVKPSSDGIKTEEGKVHSTLFLSTIFLPVMNNLAQCTLQLTRYSKTEQFCTMGLNEIEKEGITFQEKDATRTLVAKLHFKRGKARRLTGDYKKAREDLCNAKNILLSSEEASSSPEVRAVERELRLVERGQHEAKRNKKRQERAIKQVLGSKNDAVAKSPSATVDSGNELYPQARQRRHYSTLRARKSEDTDDKEPEKVEKLSYWQWYWAIVGRVAGKLLKLLGDDEKPDRKKRKG